MLSCELSGAGRCCVVLCYWQVCHQAPHQHLLPTTAAALFTQLVQLMRLCATNYCWLRWKRRFCLLPAAHSPCGKRCRRRGELSGEGPTCTHPHALTAAHN